MPNKHIFVGLFLGNSINYLVFISKIEVTTVVLIELCRQETKKRKEEETGPKCKENEELKFLVEIGTISGRNQGRKNYTISAKAERARNRGLNCCVESGYKIFSPLLHIQTFQN